MSAKFVLVAAIVTLVTVIAAVVAVFNQPGLDVADVSGEPAFPRLRAAPDAVARIVVADGERTLTLARQDNGLWVAPDQHGYPASLDAIRQLVSTMADMDLIEGKTARPDNFSRLDVEDTDGTETNSRRVRLENADGEALADVIVGKRRHGFTGGRDTGTYIRRAADERAWLASGGLVVNTAPSEWLDDSIVDVAPDTVARITIEPPGKPAYTLARDNPDAELQVEDAGDGKDGSAVAVARMTSLLSNLRFEDVRPAGDVVMPQDAGAARVRTFDGLEVTVGTADIDGANWAVVSAEAAVDAADGSDEINAVREIARAINDRTSGWAYKIAGPVAARLQTPLEGLLAGAETSPSPQPSRFPMDQSPFALPSESDSKR